MAEQKMEVGEECLDEERRLWIPFEGNRIRGLEESNLETEEVGDGKLEQKLKVAIVVGSAAHHPSGVCDCLIEFDVGVKKTDGFCSFVSW